jgi:predicted SprT family Zn-dependent metalloprotease
MIFNNFILITNHQKKTFLIIIIKRENMTKIEFLKEVEECRINASKIFKYDIQFDVQFFKSARVLGKCYFKKNVLAFNEEAIQIATTYKTTIIHEISHLIQHKYHPNSSSHGSEWKSIMMALGISNPQKGSKFLNNLKISSQVECKCNCRKIYITQNRATRMKKGTEYSCNLCHSKLEIVE